MKISHCYLPRVRAQRVVRHRPTQNQQRRYRNTYVVSVFVEEILGQLPDFQDQVEENRRNTDI